MRKIILTLFALTIVIVAWSQKGGDKGVFDNAFYARIGYAFPGGDLKTAESITAGALFEIGTIFYISDIKLPEKLKFGVDATFASISGFANQKMMNEENKTDSYFTAGFKVGPCISWNFTGHWIADAYIKFHSHMFGTGEHKYHGYEADGQKKFGTTGGLNIRWKALMLGWEFINSTYQFVRIPDTPDLESFHEGKISLPVQNITLGVKF
jgi:hypothetical protein